MGVFDRPSKPKVVAVDDEEVEKARQREQRAAILAQGRRSTVLTGNRGVGQSPVSRTVPTTGGLG